LKEYNPNLTAETELETEEKMIEDHPDYLQPTEGFAETALSYRRNGIVPVIVTSGSERLSELYLERVVEEYNSRTGENISVEDLVASENVHIVTESKKDSDTWSEAMCKYEGDDIIVLYEDSLPNLEAAMEGLDIEQGVHVTYDDSGLVEEGEDIVKGSMSEAQDYVENSD
jgi:hypothetical protein